MEIKKMKKKIFYVIFFILLITSFLLGRFFSKKEISSLNNDLESLSLRLNEQQLINQQQLNIINEVRKTILLYTDNLNELSNLADDAVDELLNIQKRNEILKSFYNDMLKYIDCMERNL